MWILTIIPTIMSSVLIINGRIEKALLICLNSDKRIICQKQQRDCLANIGLVNLEYQKIQCKMENNWHLKRVVMTNDFFHQQKSTEFAFFTFPGKSECQRICTAKKIPYQLKSMTKAKEFYENFMAAMIWLAWKETRHAFPDKSAAMLDAAPIKFRVENMGFTKLTITVNNPTPLHYNNNKYGVTHQVMYGVDENLHASYDRNGHHVLVGCDFMSGMFVDADTRGTFIIGNYLRILHANCAIFPTGRDNSNNEKARLIITCYCSQSLVD